jgi:hypothetical protein
MNPQPRFRVQVRTLAALAAGLLLNLSAAQTQDPPPAAPPQPPPVNVPASEKHVLRSQAVGADFQIYVALPF